MGKRSFLAQELRTGGTQNASRTRGEFLDVLPISTLGASERRRIEAVVEAVCPGAQIVGASVPGRSWDLRPVVVAKASKQKSQSLIRLFGPEVTLSVGLTDLIGKSLEQISQSRPRSALLIEHGMFEGQYWLRRAVVPETLAERLSHGAQLSFAEALRIGRGLIDTVTAMHAQGVIHGHICPSNVYTSPSGEVGLIDPLFGLAVIQASHLLQMEEITAGYDLTAFAPESQRKEWPGIETDIFGIGKVFWSLFSKVHRGDNSENLAEMNAAHLRSIREIILEMTDRDPNARLSFEEVVERFDEFEGDFSGSDAADFEEIVLDDVDQFIEAPEYDGAAGAENSNYAGTANFSHEFLQSAKQNEGSIPRAEQVTHEPEEHPGRFSTSARILRPGGIAKRRNIPLGTSDTGQVKDDIYSSSKTDSHSEVFFSGDEEFDRTPYKSGFSDSLLEDDGLQDLDDLSDEFEPHYDQLSVDRSYRSTLERDSSGEESFEAELLEKERKAAHLSDTGDAKGSTRTAIDSNSLFDDDIELPDVDDFDFVDHVPAQKGREQPSSSVEQAVRATPHVREQRAAFGNTPRDTREKSGREQDRVKKEQEVKFAPKPQRPRKPEESDRSSRPRSRTETLTNLIAQLQRQQSRRWILPTAVFTVGLLAAYFAVYRGAGDGFFGESIYSSADLRAAWHSGLASRMATVAEAAVSGGEQGSIAEEVLVSSVLSNDKSGEILGGGAALMRIAFDKRWEMDLSAVDRRQAIRLATAKLLGDKAYQFEQPLNSLHPGVILALTATAQDSGVPALNTIDAVNLRALPPPIGPAFAELGRDNIDLKCGDPAVRNLARFATLAAPEPIEVKEYLADEEQLAPRLRALAVLAGHDQNSASMMLGILLSHPNIEFEGELFTWAEVSKLTDWQRFDAADQLFVLAGMPPSKQPLIEHVRWMRGHPAPELRKYALEQTLDRVKLVHPAGVEILTALKDQPTALSAIQSYDLALVLENPKSVTVEQAKKWLQSSIPMTVLERMVIAASTEQTPSVVDMEIVSFLEQSPGGWNPAIEVLQKVSHSPQKYFRLLAMAKIYRHQNRGLAQQLLSAMLEKETDGELKQQLEAMIQILQAKS